ncbi:MAG TPA: M14 family zinc carboxypeptidase [Actinomycetota bacterium]|nr:M14 family zinc carboxypeptidase [Actinomycetota bacterium]
MARLWVQDAGSTNGGIEMRKLAVVVVAMVLVAGLTSAYGAEAPAAPAAPLGPVATSAEEYQTLGRIFPDPHACRPDGSPWAKGTICAVDFIQYQELLDGLSFLEETFPKFVEVYTLHEDFKCNGQPVIGKEEGCDAFRSAGVPTTIQGSNTSERDRLPLKMVRITDESVPDKGKKYFIFPLSIHGIERAGAEGGTRAVEDLATWGACEKEKAPDYVDCTHEDNVAPHPLLEATPDKSVTAGLALRKSAIYFIWPNPDGWRRGDRENGVSWYQRYNGNGVDLNRDWPEQGWTYLPYTPWSEPESRAFGRVLPAIGPKDAKGNAKWAGGIDLHGMVDAKAFSFTLLGGTQRHYGKDQRVLQTVKGAWADAEARLAYSPRIKPNSAPEQDPRQYGVQWGTIWDTIDYTVTGALGNWIDSPMGLNADGIDNEMAFSHLSNCVVGSCFDQDIEQLHVDGNKSLIYSLINYTLKPEDQTFETKGRVAYVHNRGFVKERAKNIAPAAAKWRDLPQQGPIEDAVLDESNDYTYEFAVDGPPKVYNGGIEAVITCTNVQGVSPCSASQAFLEFKGGAEHPGEEQTDDEWETINSYNGGGGDAYVPAGQALHANYPEPGQWRIRIDGGQVGLTYDADIRFMDEAAWPDPGQLAFKATSMRFWHHLAKYAKPGIGKLTVRRILKRNGWQRRYDTIVITNRVYDDLGPRLKSWVAKHDGNLVLTDEAMVMLWDGLSLIPHISGDEPSVRMVEVYAGYVNFATADKAVTYDDPLARKINQPGAAEGRSCAAKQSGITRAEGCTTTDVLHRRQTYEPVPLGYSLNEGGSPVWYVMQDAFDAAEGTARAVATGQAQNEITVGEIEYKGGRIRFVGALLPDPTKKYYHPYGLSDYALTWAGYQLLQNLLTWK